MNHAILHASLSDMHKSILEFRVAMEHMGSSPKFGPNSYNPFTRQQF
jgi:hypothetical protein